MKLALRHLAVFSFSFWLLSSWLPEGLSISHQMFGLIKTAAVFSIAMLILRPLVNTLLMPLNFIFLGSFRWISVFASLWVTIRYVNEVAISAFTLPGFSYQGFSLPSFDLNLIMAYLFFGFTITLAANVIFWIFEK
jgi:uncharacterized membrane protein YvlD (DUF360 family)